ncbi:thermonuclease family protein [Bacillus sp. SD088]|uniref:thermonuclease family protein n=1 Tax=Bacillus sp. SD088 TaxID=2782012 RepID=UPI001A963A68|nr:thermonuclease family protein [Bacillus sp. SD088]MBO0991432.1 thermonuclease family protein [Bacillus sp. SD088]
MDILFSLLFGILMVVGGIATFIFVGLLLLRAIGNKGLSIKSGAIGAGASLALFIISFVTFFMIILNSPSFENEVEEASVTDEQEVKTFTPEMQIQSAIKDNQLEVTGTTNLPDATELVITLQNDKGESFDQAVSIKDGSFSMDVVPIEELKPGEQAIEVSLADQQPDAVLEVIGEDAKLLIGPLLDDDQQLFVSANVTIPAERSPPSDVEGVKAEVTKVIDGNTILVQLDGKEEEVRMSSVAVPEAKHSKKGEQPFGTDALEFTSKSLEEKAVTLEFDDQEKDKDGRLLAYVWIEDVLYNNTLIEKGLAKLEESSDNTKYLDDFNKTQDKAKEKEIGIWSIKNYVQKNGFSDPEKKKEKVANKGKKESKEKKSIASTPAPKKDSEKMAKAPKEEKPASTETKPKVKEETKTQAPSKPKTEENSAPAPAKTPDPPAETASCDIKGSQNGIYHVPGSTYVTAKLKWTDSAR